MQETEIIVEIIGRFKLDSRSLKRLENYEYDLIYSSLSSIEKHKINKAIKDYCEKKFKIKTIRTAFLK